MVAFGPPHQSQSCRIRLMRARLGVHDGRVHDTSRTRVCCSFSHAHEIRTDGIPIRAGLCSLRYNWACLDTQYGYSLQSLKKMPQPKKPRGNLSIYGVLTCLCYALPIFCATGRSPVAYWCRSAAGNTAHGTRETMSRCAGCGAPQAQPSPARHRPRLLTGPLAIMRCNSASSLSSPSVTSTAVAAA